MRTATNTSFPSVAEWTSGLPETIPNLPLVQVGNPAVPSKNVLFPALNAMKVDVQAWQAMIAHPRSHRYLANQHLIDAGVYDENAKTDRLELPEPGLRRALGRPGLLCISMPSIESRSPALAFIFDPQLTLFLMPDRRIDQIRTSPLGPWYGCTMSMTSGFTQQWILLTQMSPSVCTIPERRMRTSLTSWCLNTSPHERQFTSTLSETLEQALSMGLLSLGLPPYSLGRFICHERPSPIASAIGTTH